MGEMEALAYATAKAAQKEDLLPVEATQAMTALISADADEEAIAAFLTALHKKGESPEELAAFAICLRQAAATSREPLLQNVRRPLVDTCGTGGGSVSTFNVSTAVGFVLAACGLQVAKHGNRGITSQTGSADVLEAMGINIHNPLEKVIGCIEEVGIGFLYAPDIHQATARVQAVRRKLPHKTFFNMLGPLTNPLAPEFQVIGAYSSEVMATLAESLVHLGVKRAMVIHGLSGQAGKTLDEASLLGETLIAEVTGKAVSQYHLDPREYGFSLCDERDLSGGTAEENAKILTRILSGHDKGPCAQLVLLNAALGVLVAEKTNSFQDAVAFSREVIESGKPYEKVQALRAWSQKK